MNILLAGEGGQGVQSVAEILAFAAHNDNKTTSYIPNFGVEQRGGVSLAYVQVSVKPINYPKFEKADIIVAMCNRAVLPVKKFISENTLFIYDSSFIDDESLKDLQGIVKKYIALPAKKIAQEELSVKVSNILFLGVLAKHIENISSEIIKIAMNSKFSPHPEFQELNNKAFDLGLNFDETKGQEFKGVAKYEITKDFSDEKKTWERFPEYCKGCGLCITICPVKALQFSDEINFLGTNLPKVDFNKCIACGDCQRICPDGAIKVTKKI